MRSRRKIGKMFSDVKLTFKIMAICFPSHPAVLTADLKPSKNELLFEKSMVWFTILTMYKTSSTSDEMCVPIDATSKALPLK